MLESLKYGCIFTVVMLLIFMLANAFGVWVLILAFLGSIGAIIYFVYSAKREKEKAAYQQILWEKEWKEQCKKSIGGVELDRFYVECVLARCADFSVPKNAEKAKLFAQKYQQYPPCTIEELFLEARSKHGTIGETLRKERLAKLKEQESQAYRESIQYWRYHGKEKMRVMLTHSIQELRNEVDLIIKGAVDRTPLTLEKERSWGVWGGIADGFAGPGAGISMAMDVQRENAQIRDRNNAKLQATMAYYTLTAMDARKIKDIADSEEKVLNSLPEKLLDDSTESQDIFKQLKFQEARVEVSETGAFRVTAYVQSRDFPKIYGDVYARIDGTILANVYEDDQLIGTAKMVLPKLGISVGREPIMGVCLNGAHPNKKQTVQFEANDLWMIEA